MKNSSLKIQEIKKKFGEIVTNAAIYNLLTFGIETYKKTTFKEQLFSIEKIFGDLRKEDKAFPVCEEFIKQILSCQMELMELDRFELMTYFTKPTNKEEIE